MCRLGKPFYLPNPPLNGPSSVYWQLVQQNYSLISTTTATAYETLGESGLKHALNEPECVGVFTDADLLRTLITMLSDVPTVSLVIYDGKPESTVKALRDDLRIISLGES